MTNVYLPQPRADGSVGVRVSDSDTPDQIKNRYVLLPGQFTDATTWVDTDLSQQPSAVHAAAQAFWTLAVVAAYKAAHPYVAPLPPDPDQSLAASVRANARRQALVTAIRASTDAQLITYINNNVTDLASARTMIANLALLVAGAIRN